MTLFASLRPQWWPDHRRSDEAALVLRARRARHPRFVHAVLDDARVHARYRSEPIHATSNWAAAIEALRLTVVSDAFLAQMLYRGKASCQRVGVPLLPALLHRLAIITGQVCIGDPVVVEPGVYLLHGQVVIDGITEVGHNTQIAPFVTIGLRAGDFTGPSISRGVSIGTGARVLGAVRVGAGATIGANAVVLSDVEARATVVGSPARPVG